jgi:hypothetical protein
LIKAIKCKYVKHFIKGFLFNKLDDIDLHDNVLRDVAQDLVRVFFISVDYDTVIVPYDGGVDLILKDKETKDQYRLKYSDWLSKRDDGL